MNYKTIVFVFLMILSVQAQEKEYNSTLVKINKFIQGTLITPYTDTNVPLIIFVMDSGAVNEDGNDRMSKSDTFKKLAITLAKKGIATYRYNNRLFTIDRYGIKEHELVLNDFINDVKNTVDYFSKNAKYSKIIVAGHGQGSLVGMMASKENVDAFISIAGNAQSVDQIVIQQLTKQAPGLEKSAQNAFDQLKQGKRATNYEPALESIFGYNLQNFMRSWIKYTPENEIKDLKIPILIIQGEKDIQTDIIEGQKLAEAVPHADFQLIPNMNHILREIKGGRIENHKSYNENWRPIVPEVLEIITKFALSEPKKDSNTSN